MKSVNISVITPWINEQITNILEFSDEIVINLVIELLKANEVFPFSFDVVFSHPPSLL